MARLWNYMGREIRETVTCACDCDQAFMRPSPAHIRPRVVAS
ncbi:hypothetical protein [Lentzea sp. NBRC 102530]|nr:hypothetical protein [Lentzea sp. NBRC 102530]